MKKLIMVNMNAPQPKSNASLLNFDKASCFNDSKALVPQFGQMDASFSMAPHCRQFKTVSPFYSVTKEYAGKRFNMLEFYDTEHFNHFFKPTRIT